MEIGLGIHVQDPIFEALLLFQDIEKLQYLWKNSPIYLEPGNP